MKIAYFDCFSGISGDMIIGALLDAGADIVELEKELSKLNLSGYRIRAEKVIRKHLSGTKFHVEIDKQDEERNLFDILEIIDNSKLDESIKNKSRKAFKELAEVEASIHGKDISEVHFHEIGAVDSIIDTVGAFICMKMLGIEEVYSSKINVGGGFVECRHGTLPVPAPATLALLKGIPIYSTGIEAELATPSGVSILKTVCNGYGKMPEMKLDKIGYGAGSRELDIPNLLRVSIGEIEETTQESAYEKSKYEKDEIALIETNIDDMSPEITAYVCETLLNQHALDVFLTPIFMKKNRPAVKLSVLTNPDKIDEVLKIIFSETTTLGVRIQRIERRKLPREVIFVHTKFGNIEVKIATTDNNAKIIAPEFENCKKIAMKNGIPLKDVYEEAKISAHKLLYAKDEVAK